MRAILCMLLLSTLSPSGLWAASDFETKKESLCLVRVLCDPNGSADEVVFECKGGQKFLVHVQRDRIKKEISCHTWLQSGEQLAIVSFGGDVLQMKRPDPFRRLTEEVLNQIKSPDNGFDRFSQVQYEIPAKTLSDDLFEKILENWRWNGLKIRL